MFNSSILDLVILLSFIYFVGSLVLSTVNEAIVGTLRLRPFQLKNALSNLFFDRTNPNAISPWQTWVDNTFKKSPHIQSLMKAKEKYPAYIPARSFVLAIIGELNSAGYNPANLQQTIAGSDLPNDLKKVLTDFAAQAQNNLTAFEKNVETFYTDAMDRAGGVYKKWIRLLLLAMGLIFSVVLNLDTIKIINEQLSNKEQLSKNVDNISKQMAAIKIGKDSTDTFEITTADGMISVNRTRQIWSSVKDTIAFDDKKETPKDSDPRIGQSVATVQRLSYFLAQTSGYNIGYDENGGFCKAWDLPLDKFLLKVLGVLITAFALQLGSNFWFDLINKAINIRASGKKPETKN